MYLTLRLILKRGGGGGDTSGVDTVGGTVGVDAPMDELSGMDVVGEIAGENCTGVDVFVFKGEEQGGSEIPGGMHQETYKNSENLSKL